jgi:hypothetical protein
MPNSIELSNYVFEDLIFSSEKSFVFRAFSELDKKNVIVKILKGDFPTIQQLKQFKYEYEIAKKN